MSNFYIQILGIKDSDFCINKLQVKSCNKIMCYMYDTLSNVIEIALQLCD